MPDPLFNPAHNKSVPLSGNVWVITYNGAIVFVTASAVDCNRVLAEALSKSTEEANATGVIIVSFAKGANLIPVPITTVGGRFAT